MKILIRIATVYLHIKRIFINKNLVLEMIKHKRHRTSHKRQGKQRSQRSHGKTHRLYFAGKLAHQKQIVPPIDRISFFSYITGNPCGNSRIKQIDT